MNIIHRVIHFEGYGAGNAWGSLGGVKDVDGDTLIGQNHLQVPMKM